MPTPGGVLTSLAGMVANLTQRRPSGRPGKGPTIEQFADTFQPSGGMFAPGYPLVPPERERLRVTNFPVGYNYNYTPRAYEKVGFEQLRGLASTHDITRLCIETRKDQIEQLNWTIGPIDPKNPGSMTEERSDELTKFWRKPDGYNPFGTWLRTALEDLLVLDAPTFEVRRNRGGDIIALDVIDGATIKVLIDDTGRRPLPPAPAYEQVIHGRPWVLAEDGRINTDDAPLRQLFDTQIIYLPRNPRTHSQYGMSPVEQIIMTVNTSIRRQVQQLQYFTVGNMPKGTIDAPQGWTPEQIAVFQEWFDTLLEGNTGNRQKAIWIPPGSKYRALLEAPDKSLFDEWLARIVCFAFSLPPNAFVERINRATAQTAQEAALQEGLAPLMAWAKRLVDSVIQDRMGHADLEFQWSQQTELDPQVQATILSTYVRDGLYTFNEARDTLGLDAIENGDQNIILTAAGPILLSNVLAGGTPGGASQLPDGAQTEQQSAKAATLSKDDAGYTARSKVSDHCALCSMFVPDDACTLVRGNISPAGWCRHFDPVTEKVTETDVMVHR